jgi:hypothetical protein
MAKKKVPIHVWAIRMKEKARKYKNYRVVFYNFMLNAQKRIGLILKMEMQEEAGKFADTGTFRKRTDYKVLEWNKIVFGVFEPNSEYYDSKLHNPTGKVSKYTGRVVPPDSVYARIPYDKRSPFISNIVKRLYNKELKKEVNEFNKEYFIE